MTRKRKKPTDPVERAFDDLEQMVSETFEEAAKQQASAKKHQTDAKKVGAARIREGKHRQAATKKAVRGRRGKTS